MATLSVAADGIALREEGDRSLGDGVRCLADQEPAAAVGCRVADGEFLLGPRAGEMAVGLAEVDHCWLGSMTRHGGCRVLALTPKFSRRAAARVSGRRGARAIPSAKWVKRLRSRGR